MILCIRWIQSGRNTERERKSTSQEAILENVTVFYFYAFAFAIVDIVDIIDGCSEQNVYVRSTE